MIDRRRKAYWYKKKKKKQNIREGYADILRVYIGMANRGSKVSSYTICKINHE